MNPEELLIAIGQLESQYLTELAAANEKLVGLIKDKEPQDIVYKARVQQAKLTGQSVELPADKMKEGFAKRHELGQRYIEQLKAMLTPEQIALLPGLGTVQPGGRLGPESAAGATGKTEANKKARQEKLRRLREGGGPSIEPKGGGSVKGTVAKQVADN